MLLSVERVRVGLDANLDRPARLVGVDVVQRRVGRARRADDAVDDPVGGRVVAALERRQVQHDHVRVVRREDGAIVESRLSWFPFDGGYSLTPGATQADPQNALESLGRSRWPGWLG